MERFAKLVLVVGLLSPAATRADEPPDDCPLECRIGKVREMLARGEVSRARDELVELHRLTAAPQLLFALGQVELQLEHYEAAIGYYERFIATNPSEEQISLAQQAIGAARMRLVEPKPKPPEPPPPRPRPPEPPPPPVVERRWDVANTVLVSIGGAAIAVGAGLLYNAHRIGNDTSGTLAEYDDRLEHAQIRRFSGVGFAAGGAITIALALVRWRFDKTVLDADASPDGATVTVSRRW